MVASGEGETLTTDFDDEALSVLRRALGPTAEFRDGQLESIGALVQKRNRILVVQRTGWGKSAVYFVATKLLRDRGAGPTLLVSPLLSLMRNQIDAGGPGGVRAWPYHERQHRRVGRDRRRDLRRDDVDLLLVSPERFANRRLPRPTCCPASPPRRVCS